jgi:hypothetical protein
MKIRGSILGFVVVAAVLIALILWFGRKPTAETPPVVSSETNAAPTTPPAANAPVFNNASTAAVASASAPTAATEPQSQLPQDKVAIIKEVLQANDANIEFYGRLEDQSGSAVFDAEINFSIPYENADSRGIHRGQVMSDNNGVFTISGYKGANLVITPQKKGYALAMTGTSFRYSQLQPGYFVPDANNPVVIKMWKLQGAEPLLSINQRYKFQYTATPINFDLLAGKIVPVGGDIQIVVSRSSGVVSGRTRQGWGVQVAAVDGGLMGADGQEGITFEAPENGYQPSTSLTMSTNAPYKWFGGVDQTYFLESRNAQVYSKVNFSITINQQPDDYVWVEFHGVANTNGSRNWEATVPQ